MCNLDLKIKKILRKKNVKWGLVGIGAVGDGEVNMIKLLYTHV
jgi:hypothetical protein